jgi:Ser/Thr protein kinase RdoA (MazF antagonist)
MSMKSFSTADAQRLASEYYGLTAVARPLPGYEAQNFYLQTETGQEFVLKIAKLDTHPEDIDFQYRVLEALVECGNPGAYPRPCVTLSGDEFVTITDADGHPRLMQLLTYLPGVLLAHATPHHPDLLYNLGQFLGQLNKTLQDFTHPDMYRTSKWDLKNTAASVKSHLDDIPSPSRRAIVKHLLTRFERHVLPILPELGASVIHNDANIYNVLVANTEVSGLLDFEEIVFTPTVFELAVAIAYAVLDKEDPLSTANHIAAGYHDILPLTEQEVSILYDSICARLCISVSMSAYYGKLFPENDYIRILEKPAWNALHQLVQVSPQQTDDIFWRIQF